ncbi:MAG: tetratricopeptide repeat protein [Thermoanaerobaculia bacterium]
MRRAVPIFFVILLAVSSAFAADTFYDAYDAGLNAVKQKDWSTAISKMSEAIAKNPKENDRTRTYGNIFISYHPYYYRGIAYFSTNEFEKAISDFQRATGAGAVDLGSVNSFIERTETRLTLIAQQREIQQQQQAAATTTQAQPAPSQPPPSRPAQPAVDPLLAPARTRAEGLLVQAEKKRLEARRSRAETYAASAFNDGEELLLDAKTKAAAASKTADWRSVGDLADRAARTFDAAATRAQIEVSNQQTAPSRATEVVMADMKVQVRQALQFYFEGDFKESARQFDKLTRVQKNNPMLWAFLGASQFYSYYLEGESNAEARQNAVRAFRQARTLDRHLELSAQYFSPRVRKFYSDIQ